MEDGKNIRARVDDSDRLVGLFLWTSDRSRANGF